MKDDASTARERLGQILRDRWLLEQVLGVGGMAAVYAARHRNGARAAIKLLHGPVREDPTMRERFLREAYLANTVDHAGIARVLDDDEDPKLGPFLIMELLDGESIDELFKRKAGLPLEKVLDLADQTLDVLAAAHEKGIVHRDLKPANLFLCRNGQVKVLDFGIARLLFDNANRLTHTGMMVGTPAYMSPEQARTGGRMVDGRSDLYSLGATMFRIISGRHVHVGKLAQLIVQVATERSPKLCALAPHVPANVGAIVDRSLEFEPERRYSSARDMQQDVRAVRAGHAPPIAGRSLPPAPPIPSLESLQAPRRPTGPISQALAKDGPTLAARLAREQAHELARRADAFRESPQPQPIGQSGHAAPPAFSALGTNVTPPAGYGPSQGGAQAAPNGPMSSAPYTVPYEQGREQQRQQAYSQQQQQHAYQQQQQQQHAHQQQQQQQQQQQPYPSSQQAQAQPQSAPEQGERTFGTGGSRPAPPLGWQVSDAQREARAAMDAQSRGFVSGAGAAQSAPPRSDAAGAPSVVPDSSKRRDTFKSTMMQVAPNDPRGPQPLNATMYSLAGDHDRGGAHPPTSSQPHAPTPSPPYHPPAAQAGTQMSLAGPMLPGAAPTQQPRRGNGLAWLLFLVLVACVSAAAWFVLRRVLHLL